MSHSHNKQQAAQFAALKRSVQSAETALMATKRNLLRFALPSLQRFYGTVALHQCEFADIKTTGSEYIFEFFRTNEGGRHLISFHLPAKVLEGTTMDTNKIESYAAARTLSFVDSMIEAAAIERRQHLIVEVDKLTRRRDPSLDETIQEMQDEIEELTRMVGSAQQSMSTLGGDAIRLAA